MGDRKEGGGRKGEEGERLAICNGHKSVGALEDKDYLIHFFLFIDSFNNIYHSKRHRWGWV
jgi:hypothetical protein